MPRLLGCAFCLLSLLDFAPGSQAEDFSQLSGAQLIERLAAPETRRAAFAQLFLQTEALKERENLGDYLDPQVVICPQGDGAPIAIVLCKMKEPQASDPLRYQISDVETLFPLESADVPVTAQGWMKERVLFAYSAAGEKLTPFGGWNLLSGFLFDLNGDGSVESAEVRGYGGDQPEESVDELHVARVESRAVGLLDVVINRGKDDSWGWALQREADGTFAIAIGPKDNPDAEGPAENSNGWALRSVAAVYRWNKTGKRFEGPTGSPAEHFLRVDSKTDFERLVETVGALSPFPTPEPMPAATPAAPALSSGTPLEVWHYVSLRGRSDAELLEIMTGGKDANEVEREAIVPTHLPEGFWSLPPKEAALALVEANRSPENRRDCRLAIDDRGGAVPPVSGQVWFEWTGGGCGFAPRAGRTQLDYTPGRSRCSLAQVTLQSEVDSPVIADALSRPRTVAVPNGVARQVYETIWWLGRVRNDCGSHLGAIGRPTSSSDGALKFRLAPEAQPLIEVALVSLPFSSYWNDGYDREVHANLAFFLLRQFEIEKIGLLDPAVAPPAIGGPRQSTPEEEFLSKQEPPEASQPAAVEAYVKRLLEILQMPHTTVSKFSVIGHLVPNGEPLRFRDARIDEALSHMARAGLSVDGEGPHFADLGYARYAAAALALRDRPEAFDLLVALLGRGESLGGSTALAALSFFTVRHPEFRDRLRGVLEKALHSIHKSQLDVGSLFDAVWIGQFRELTPLLEKLSTSSADEIASQRSSGSGLTSDGTVSRFHEARRILTAWEKQDPLTHAKLYALIEAYTDREVPTPDLIGPLFEHLSSEERVAFRTFLAWCEKHEEKPRAPKFSDYARKRFRALQSQFR